MRGFYPGLEFEETDPYREPYVNFAHEVGITKQQSGPYLSYLITRYELVLELYRVAQKR
ncbi:MAG: hypothetical protein H6765_07175 [Candidatus Peribacteria bacterium]|nr:MAG: hypothetical protein H6765_07175 [Candidatus Peribacteria bacterium]